MIELISWNGQTIAVDIVGEVNQESKADLTDYPIEDGALRSDHKIVQARLLDLEIKQTETPLEDPQFATTDRLFNWSHPTSAPKSFKLSVEAVRTKIMSPFLMLGGAVRDLFAAADQDTFTGQQGGADAQRSFTMGVLQTATPRDRGLELDALLQALHDSPDTCTVTYRGKVHPDMSLIGLGRNWTSKGLTSWSCSFKQLRTASIARVDLVDPAALALKAKKTDGKQNAKTKEGGATPEKEESILHRMAR